MILIAGSHDFNRGVVFVVCVCFIFLPLQGEDEFEWVDGERVAAAATSGVGLVNAQLGVVRSLIQAAAQLAKGNAAATTIQVLLLIRQ